MARKLPRRIKMDFLNSDSDLDAMFFRHEKVFPTRPQFHFTEHLALEMFWVIMRQLQGADDLRTLPKNQEAAMNRPKHIIFVISLVFAMAAAAGAQMAMRQTPLPRGIFRPVVGEGAVYETTNLSGPKNTIEFDVVGKDSVDGKDAYWLEFTIAGTQMGDVLSKILMVVDAGVTYNARTIVQMGNNPPMEMPAAMASKAQTPVEIKDKADDLGIESVTVPAGTFSCEHYKMKDGTGEAWVSDKVTPFGLVKSQGKDSSMVLLKTVTGVTDKITGTPVPFNPMMFMGRGGR
jgi:hypothetical protein